MMPAASSVARVDRLVGVETTRVDRGLDPAEIDLVEAVGRHRVEAALGQAAMQGHLAAFEAADAHTRACGLALAAAGRRLTLAGAKPRPSRLRILIAPGLSLISLSRMSNCSRTLCLMAPNQAPETSIFSSALASMSIVRTSPSGAIPNQSRGGLKIDLYRIRKAPPDVVAATAHGAPSVDQAFASTIRIRCATLAIMPRIAAVSGTSLCRRICSDPTRSASRVDPNGGATGCRPARP